MLLCSCKGATPWDHSPKGHPVPPASACRRDAGGPREGTSAQINQRLLSGTGVYVAANVNYGVSNCVHRYDPARRDNETIDVGQPVGAVAPRAMGGLVLALRDGFGLLDTATGGVEMVADTEADVATNRMNDGACDNSGRFWARTTALDERPALYRLDVDRPRRRWWEASLCPMVSAGAPTAAACTLTVARASGATPLAHTERGNAACTHRKGPSRFVVRIRRQSSKFSVASACWDTLSPALLTRMSSHPNRPCATATMRCTCDGTAMSHETTSRGSAEPRSLSAAAMAAVPQSVDSVRPTRTTSAPSATNKSAVARPMPLPAPVTTATRLSNRRIHHLSHHGQIIHQVEDSKTMAFYYRQPRANYFQ